MKSVDRVLDPIT